MNDAPTAGQAVDPAEQILRAELARGDTMLARVRSVLLNLLQIEGQELFSDEVVARIRGMSFDVASRLLAAEAGEAGTAQFVAPDISRQDAFAQVLIEDPQFLAHAHALVLEGQLAERLHARGGVDPVTPPLVQDLVASEDSATASLAMSVLAAQARFMQHHRRMELPLSELPGDLFHKALLLLRGDTAGTGEGERSLRAAYDEGTSRLGLLSRLFVILESDTGRALMLEEAGVAIFATTLAHTSGQDRDLAVVSMTGRQPARFGLTLRAAGLCPKEVRDRLFSLHPDVSVPEGLETLPPAAAAMLLSAPEAGLVV